MLRRVVCAFAVVLAVVGCRTTSGDLAPMEGAALQDAGPASATMQLPEGSVRLTVLDSANAVVVPAAGGRRGSTLRLTYTLNGCVDKLGPVLHNIVRRRNGKIDVFVYALNVHTQASMVARCAAMPTAQHEIWLGHRTRTMADVTLKHLNRAAVTHGAGGGSETSIELPETALSLRVAMGSVNTVGVSAPRCARGAECPPPRAAIELSYSLGCLSSIGPVAYDAVVNPRARRSVKVIAGAVEVIDRRSLSAFCIAGATAMANLSVEGVQVGTTKDDVSIVNLAPSRTAARPVAPDNSGSTVVSPDPDGGFVTCMAFWTGYWFDEAAGACRSGGRSGCSNPFPFETSEECQAAHPAASSPVRPPVVCMAYFSGFNFNADFKTCEYGAGSGCSNPYAFQDLDACMAAHIEARNFGRNPDAPEELCLAFFEGFHLDRASKKCVEGSASGCKNPFPYEELDDCKRRNGIR